MDIWANSSHQDLRLFLEAAATFYKIILSAVSVSGVVNLAPASGFKCKFDKFATQLALGVQIFRNLSLGFQPFLLTTCGIRVPLESVGRTPTYR